VRLPGTFRQLLAQVKASPVPIGSITLPTEHGPLTLTFGELPLPAPPPKPPERKPVEVKPLRERDTVGAFKTPPIAREDPWQPPADGAA